MNITQTIKGVFDLVAWWHKYKVRKAVGTLRRAAIEMLRRPNGQAIESKTFWSMKLQDPSLINEALHETAHFLPGFGDGAEELWEVDAGQPNLAHEMMKPRFRR